jgi:hypothetical protein
MIQSVLSEIKKLRLCNPLAIDSYNSNRYCLRVLENNGTKTSYFFSTPIYNRNTCKLIDMSFQINGDTVCMTGSNANISLSHNIFIKNGDGSIVIELPKNQLLVSKREIRSGFWVITPTGNGISVKCNLENCSANNFVVEVDYPYSLRSNDRCLAFMKENNRPSVVLSCIGALDGAGNAIAPAKFDYQKLSDKKYKINISATSLLSQAVFFEVNMYENKLFQDTTVESLNPKLNNAFGGVAFLGTSTTYGEQWLYSRLDYSRIPEVMDKRINKVLLHIPKLNNSMSEIVAFKTMARFCSLNSNWKNKIEAGPRVAASTTANGYESLDLTSFFIDPCTRMIAKSEGLILKTKEKGSIFSAIATGDSYHAPQILEINYN